MILRTDYFSVDRWHWGEKKTGTTVMALVVLAWRKKREGEKTKTTMIRVEKHPKYNNDDMCCSLQSLAGLFRAFYRVLLPKQPLQWSEGTSNEAAVFANERNSLHTFGNNGLHNIKYWSLLDLTSDVRREKYRHYNNCIDRIRTRVLSHCRHIHKPHDHRRRNQT